MSEINGLYLTFPFFSFFFSFGSINMWRSCNKNSCHLSNAYSAPSRLLGLPCMWGGGELHEEQRGICALSGKVSGCSFLRPGPFTPGRPVRIIQISGLLAVFRSHGVSISPSFLQPFFPGNTSHIFIKVAQVSIEKPDIETITYVMSKIIIC